MVGGGKNFTSDRFALQLDGSAAGLLHTAEGGWLSAPVITDRSAESYFARKHLGVPHYEPVALQFDFSLESTAYEWIQSWSRGEATPKKGALDTLDFQLNRKSSREFSDARIDQLTLPALSRHSKQPCYFTMIVIPAAVSPLSSVIGGAHDPSARAGQRRWLSLNFRLEIAGLDCSQVQAVDGFTIKSVGTEEAGGAGSQTLLDFPNLRVTLAQVAAQSWIEWHEDFVSRGNNDDAHERQGALVLLSSAQQELCRIHLFNLGIFRIAPASVNTASESPTPMLADLYCERMEFSFSVQSAP